MTSATRPNNPHEDHKSHDARENAYEYNEPRGRVEIARHRDTLYLERSINAKRKTEETIDTSRQTMNISPRPHRTSLGDRSSLLNFSFASSNEGMDSHSSD